MPFKIVQTSERGKEKLFIVPTNWEWSNRLRYPKKNTDHKLARDENSKPRPEWNVMACKTKRMGFVTYEDAEEELTRMLENSDTDFGEENRREKNSTTSNINFFNDMADQLILQDSIALPTTSQVITEEVPLEETYYYMNNTNDGMLTTEPPGQPDIMTQKLNTILENQKLIMDKQNKFGQRLGNFVIEIEAIVERTVNRLIKTIAPTPLPQAAALNENQQLKPISSLQELEHFELLLSEPAKKHLLKTQYSILCTESKGHGISCAYKLVDVLFTRDFLCKCSWSGGSRGDTVKIALKQYKHMLDFCFRMVLTWDTEFTIEKLEKFFKLVLRNAEQRKNQKNLRQPSMRKRRLNAENKESVKAKKNMDRETPNVENENPQELQTEEVVVKTKKNMDGESPIIENESSPELHNKDVQNDAL